MCTLIEHHIGNMHAKFHFNLNKQNWLFSLMWCPGCVIVYTLKLQGGGVTKGKKVKSYHI